MAVDAGAPAPAGEASARAAHASPAAEQLDLVDAPAAPEAAQSVLGRLRAREAERAAEAARRLEQLSVAADPRESVEAFMANFSSQRQALAAAIDSAASSAVPASTVGSSQAAPPAAAADSAAADPAAAAKAALEKAGAELAELEAAVAEAAYFLPPYDLRQCTLAVAVLKEAQEAAIAALQPRRRFAFSCKAAAPAAAAPAAAAAAAPAAAAAVASAAREEGAPSIADGACSSSANGSSSGTSFRGLSGRTIVHRCAADGTEDCTLSGLQDCTVFLLGTIAALFAHQLQRCKLYTGPVAGACLVEDASDCTLVLASRQVRIHSAHRCDFYLRIRSNPIIEHSDGLRFAPYAFSYPGSEADLAAADLTTDSGRWAEVQDFGWLRATPSPHWSVLPETERLAAPAVPKENQSSGEP